LSLLVEATGSLLLVEDLGRAGLAHVGVPPSGALDPAALTLANRLVGNAEDAAGLEVLLGGVRLQAQTSTRVALTGAQRGLRIGGREAAWGSAQSVRAGEGIEIGTEGDGLRCWLAVAGGIDVPVVLGSRSTDTLTDLGPAVVSVGDRLPVGLLPPPAAAATALAADAAPRVVPLAVLLGPRDDWFTDRTLERFFANEYVVSASSNRTALRLEGAEPLERRVAAELPSEGVVTGAVQVPTNGQPLIFLADHPVTGGYPVLGVVEAGDLARCAQARPGDRLRFVRLRGLG
jgi:biotin-dependent carboxylase-like uncharacterized protein